MPLDLFITWIVGISVLFLAVVVYFHDRKSALNKTFALISLATIGNIVSVYVSLYVSPESALFWIRFTLAFAVPHTILLFVFVHTFPNRELRLRGWKLVLLALWAGAITFLVASPWVFTDVVVNGGVAPIVSSLIYPVAATIVGFLLASLFLTIKRYMAPSLAQRAGWLYVMGGMCLTYSLLVFLIFIAFNFLHTTFFVQFAAAFMLPMIVGMAYALLQHHLLNTKVIATEILTYVVIVVALFQAFIAQTALIRALSTVSVLSLIIFGVFLIRSVLREVHQRELLEELTVKLQAANTQLEELSKFKTQFVSLASHQIKSPLAAIKGFASILLEGLYGPIAQKPRGALEKIKSAVDELINLINTLLDLRKVEEGKMSYEMKRINLRELVEALVEELRPLAIEKKLKLEFISQKPEFLVSADGQKLKQVVQNLVDNAIKYTPSGFVAVKLEDRESKALLSVKDTGLGIASALLPQLFEEFVRDERVKKEIRGTGLGLYIARKIVEAHSGRIWAESGGEGKGSTFYLELAQVK